MLHKIVKAVAIDALIIHQLVHQIYKPTYKDILPLDQIDFMLEKSYTIEALHEAMQNGQDFYILYEKESNPVGFMSIQKNLVKDVLRIEKLYLLPSVQGKGYGYELISFAKETAKKLGCSSLQLNVNRNNKAYFFYLKIGFKVIKEVDIPYYGYVLDDYIMEKSV